MTEITLGTLPPGTTIFGRQFYIPKDPDEAGVALSTSNGTVISKNGEFIPCGNLNDLVELNIMTIAEDATFSFEIV